MVRMRSKHFSVDQISESGQCFRLNRTGDNQYGLTALGRYLEVRQEGEEVFFSCTQEEFDDSWRRYFDLDTDYGRFAGSVPENDSYIWKTVRFGSGIRILRQELWEVLVTFIISQQNNMKRIKRSVEQLCERYGEEKQAAGGFVYHTFPGPEALAGVPEEALKACGLGYRSRYILSTADSVLRREVDLDAVGRMGYTQAKKELLRLCGVGSKVADCICLFSLHHLEAFPVDTHINRVLKLHYPQGFPFEDYAGHAGVMQQYIFYYDLKKGKIGS